MRVTTILLMLMGLTSSFCFGQSGYEKAMEKAFQYWSEGKTKEAAALFERVSQAETDNWLPTYYTANVLIATSFSVDSMELRTAMLKKAEKNIALAHERSPDNSEILTLEGVLYTSYVAMDPAVYAMQYSNKIMNLHTKAIELDPKNPRAQVNKIEYEMGSARFFGQDLRPFCDRMKEIIPLFKEQESEVPFAPSWGIERAEQVANSCS